MDNIYIEDYQQQLNLLGYYNITDYNDFKNNIKISIDYDMKHIKNIPSILIDSKNNNISILQKRWEKNVYNIFNSILKTLKITDNIKTKIINNNYIKIKNNFNKNKYYKNINEILGI